MRPLQPFFICVFLMWMGMLSAQTFTVKGYVYSGDYLKPVYGARVIQEGVGEMAITDRKGAFSITTSSERGTLTIHYIGHEYLRVEFGPGNYILAIRVRPAPTISLKEEVVKDSSSDTLKSPGVYVSPKKFAKMMYKDPRVHRPQPGPVRPPRESQPPGRLPHINH